MSKNLNGSVAVLLPCYNEEITIGKVVHDFRTALPNADMYMTTIPLTILLKSLRPKAQSSRGNHVKAKVT